MNQITKEQLRGMVKENNFKTPDDVMSFMKDTFKDVIQEMLEAELENSLGYGKYDSEGIGSGNSRNGYSNKIVRTDLGNIALQIPRDRKGEFEPQIVPKHKRDISGIEEKVISLYARGMTTRDIHDQIKDLYGVEISAELVSKITDKIIPHIKEWQSNPLDDVYPFVFMDAIHFKVRTDGKIVNKAAYVVVGVNLEGFKKVLGIWIGENESSKFWLGVLNELKNRGVKDILIFSVDGLSGLKEAIEAAYPKSEIQRCIIHQLRNSFKYVSYKDYKQFAKDFKAVYKAPTEEAALENLYEAKEKWGIKYPYAIKSWEDNWDILSTYFKFSDEIRRIIYTTNIIESLHRQYRKVTKAKSVFPTDMSLLKMLYLATGQIEKRWTTHFRNWDQVLNQLMIMYKERLEAYIYKVG